ncbi:MAG: hypothetical protein R3325_15155 [Thermoanaerobaculia bacterium]|nr:hypothetical protein [Thermoanaerobaculia bacterium]
MTRAVLSFPTAAISLVAPPEVLAEVEALYPGAPTKRRFPAEESTLSVTAGEGRYRLETTPGPPRRFRTAADAALALALEIERLVLARRGDRPALHAGGVEVDGGAWLLAGRAESGKTSTTFQLAELGCPLLCEEIAILDPENRVLPFPQALRLEPDFVEEARRDGPPRGELTAGPDRLLRYRPPRRARAPRPLTALLLPRYRPSEPPRLARREPAESILELLGHCFEPLADEEPLFDRILTLAHSTPIHELVYPDAGSARRLLLELLDRGPE